MNEKIKYLGYLAVFLLGLVVGFVLWGLPSNVEAITKNWHYSDTWENQGKCVPIAECGTDEGLQTQVKTRECKYGYKYPYHKCAKLGAIEVWDTRQVKCETETPACPTPTPTPTPEPEPTPEPTPVPSKPNPITPAGPPPVCTGKDLGSYAPTITSVWRVDNDTVGACWTSPDEDVNQYVVWYGLSQDNLPWNTIAKDTCVELNEVPDQHIWLKVAGSDGCLTGVYSEVVDP